MVILQKTDQLTGEIHKDLAKRNLSFKQVSVIAIITDLSVRSRSKTLETATNDLAHLRQVVRELFGKFLNESKLEVRRVGVKVSQFSKDENEQKKLTSFLGS
jgi:DNA polymerase IV (DinB-like DNA polymerase)